MSILIAAGHVVTPGAPLAPGWIAADGDRITALGAGPPPGPPDRTAAWALPGFIDLHVHGGGGASFTEGDAAGARRAAAFHRARGTTRMLASLVTAPLAELERRAGMLAGLAAEGVIDGIHLEGPFLSAARCGAQNPRYLVPPSAGAFERLRVAARGWLRVITIAPELPGAAAVITAAAEAGVVVAAGHTDASAAVTDAAVSAGVSHATHLFNGMRPLRHREPGPAGALLDRQVTCEVIADGIHLHDATVRLAARAAGPGNLVLITDAMAAAGMPDGDYALGELAVTVAGGTARLRSEPSARTGPAAPGAIAGSTATMDQVVRRAITSVGLSPADVAAASAATPARILGLSDSGQLSPGQRADIALLDEDFRLTAVLARGRWVGPVHPALP
ncbi:MAG TPA: N-acetylglucosamine-6-phosphate deacetylase [Trebonia sp.]|nr:N-acetylglucosamine-6-phosphate deacetylase [Trebonia sp.]